MKKWGRHHWDLRCNHKGELVAKTIGKCALKFSMLLVLKRFGIVYDTQIKGDHMNNSF